jgi:hypothetical protein
MHAPAVFLQAAQRQFASALQVAQHPRAPAPALPQTSSTLESHRRQFPQRWVSNTTTNAPKYRDYGLRSQCLIAHTDTHWHTNMLLSSRGRHKRQPHPRLEDSRERRPPQGQHQRRVLSMAGEHQKR